VGLRAGLDTEVRGKILYPLPQIEPHFTTNSKAYDGREEKTPGIDLKPRWR
jgi:hypothetical protein